MIETSEKFLIAVVPKIRLGFLGGFYEVTKKLELL